MAYYQQGYRPPANRPADPRRPATTARTGASPAGGKKRPPARRRRRRNRRYGRLLATIAVLVLLAALASGAVMVYAAYDEIESVEQQNTFYRGIYIDGYELYGATAQEAYDFLLGQARQKLTGWAINLEYEGRTWQITTDVLGMSQALESVVAQKVNECFQLGRTSHSTGLAGIFDRYRQIQSFKDEPYMVYTSNIEKDTSALDGILAEIKAAVDVEVKDATLTFNPERQNPIIIGDETYGKSLNTAELKAQLLDMINNMEQGTIQVTPETIVPQHTKASLQGQIVQLANFSTVIRSNSTPERNYNIEVGCNAFHGKVIRAGQKVSFNDFTGKRSEENGYAQALEIVSGEYRMGWGGGICQVSSTLYNACIQAGLEIVSRTAHGLAVNYAEMGADATVADRGIDFVFRNNTGSDIYLVARLVTSGNTKTCLFQIYGRPDPNGYTYELFHETLETIPIPETTPIPDKKAEYVVYTDQTKQVSKGSEGYVVRTYLITRASNGSIVDKEELYTDTYKPTAAQVYVGVTPRQ